LLLTQRGDQRPGGASAQALGDHPRPSTRRRVGAVAGVELPSVGAAGAGHPRPRHLNRDLRALILISSQRVEVLPPGDSRRAVAAIPLDFHSGGWV